jgi:hypothetical protein
VLRYGGQLESQRSRKVPEAAPLYADGFRLSQPRPYALLLDGGSGPRAVGPEATSQQITVSTLRLEVKRVMQAAGRPPSAYGTHSLRIGQATARAFVGADKRISSTPGNGVRRRISSRERRAESLRMASLACGADVDDFENEFLAIEQDPDSLVMADSSDED